MGEIKAAAPAIGIDLGTTYSCVGVWRNRKVDIIANDLGNRTTPSCVAFTQQIDHRLIGEAAVNQLASNSTNTVFDCKRLIGRRFSDQTIQEDMKTWPFKVIEGPNEKPLITVQYKGEEKKFTPEHISSMVLIKMKETAEAYIGAKVSNAVITVPAYFTNSQRQDTRDAGTIAGFKGVRMINEPTAAAIAYGLDKNIGSSGKKNVLIFDLGGGTLDVSLVTIEKGTFDVRAVTGDSHLGGQDFNNRIINHLVEVFKKKHKKDISNSAKALRKLRTASEKAKKFISVADSTSIEIDCLFDDIDFQYNMFRSTFERLNMDYFDKCIELVKDCLEQGKLDKTGVHDVVLVGGSSRIPKVQAMLKDFFDGKELCKGINPDEAIAYGAAVRATIFSNLEDKGIPEVKLLDVTPLSLGIEANDGEMSVIIPRSSKIPVKKEKTYLNSKDNQTKVAIIVYEGERARTKDNHLLDKFSLSGIRAAPVDTVRLHVCFEIDDDGILHVVAEERSSGAKSQIKITSSGKMSPKEMEKMIEDSEKLREEEEKYKRMAIAKNALESYMNKVMQSGSKLAPSSKAKVQEAVSEASILIENLNTTAEDFENGMKKLENICNGFL